MSGAPLSLICLGWSINISPLSVVCENVVFDPLKLIVVSESVPMFKFVLSFNVIAGSVSVLFVSVLVPVSVGKSDKSGGVYVNVPVASLNAKPPLPLAAASAPTDKLESASASVIP